jgi:hypothetical protein
MKTYLRVVNPIVALLVLVLCLWAGTFDDGRFKPHALLEGGLSTCFLTKGLFCSSALFLVGKIVLLMENRLISKSRRRYEERFWSAHFPAAALVLRAQMFEEAAEAILEPPIPLRPVMAPGTSWNSKWKCLS